ncbi:MAG: OmpA family protein [Proteobacteria bacterium]|nr:OmpA family protein [Pseudomonadota bacterium]
MKTKALLTLSALAMLAGSVQAGEYTDGRIYGGVSGGIYFLDDDRRTNDDGLIYGFNLGRFFTENLSFDVEYTEFLNDPQFDQSVILENNLRGATTRYTMHDISLMGRYHFGEDDGFRPYVAFGIGATKHDHVLDRATDMSATLGLGFQSDWGARGHWFARVEADYRYVGDDSSLLAEDSYGDVLLKASLNYKFGADPRPPVVIAEAVAVDGDADGDGVPDSRDRCPNTPAGVAVDQYGCSLDSDGDGVPNSRDKCPDTRAGAVVDLDGCEIEAVIDLRNVNFEFDSATLKTSATEKLDTVSELLASHGSVVVEVAGHTDSVGPEDYNQGLSERRANSVRDYLIAKGISSDRMSAKGYGEARPVGTNDTKDGRAANRRVELIVLDR